MSRKTICTNLFCKIEEFDLCTLFNSHSVVRVIDHKAFEQYGPVTQSNPNCSN